MTSQMNFGDEEDLVDYESANVDPSMGDAGLAATQTPLQSPSLAFLSSDHDTQATPSAQEQEHKYDTPPTTERAGAAAPSSASAGGGLAAQSRCCPCKANRCGEKCPCRMSAGGPRKCTTDKDSTVPQCCLPSLKNNCDNDKEFAKAALRPSKEPATAQKILKRPRAQGLERAADEVNTSDSDGSGDEPEHFARNKASKVARTQSAPASASPSPSKARNNKSTAGSKRKHGDTAVDEEDPNPSVVSMAAQLQKMQLSEQQANERAQKAEKARIKLQLELNKHQRERKEQQETSAKLAAPAAHSSSAITVHTLTRSKHEPTAADCSSGQCAECGARSRSGGASCSWRCSRSADA